MHDISKFRDTFAQLYATLTALSYILPMIAHVYNLPYWVTGLLVVTYLRVRTAARLHTDHLSLTGWVELHFTVRIWRVRLCVNGNCLVCGSYLAVGDTVCAII
jgi:1,4-dihydroxy-2-naphthoate octaprenyltransferase